MTITVQVQIGDLDGAMGVVTAHDDWRALQYTVVGAEPGSDEAKFRRRYLHGIVAEWRDYGMDEATGIHYREMRPDVFLRTLPKRYGTNWTWAFLVYDATAPAIIPATEPPQDKETIEPCSTIG